MPHYDDPHLSDSFLDIIPRNLKLRNVFFVCIGTDRSTGDSLGPLVGTYLERAGYLNVIGTMDDPCHAMNLQERLVVIPKGKTVIAVDACLGQVSSIGNVKFAEGGLRPGAGVNKNLGVVGNYHITGCVNVGGFMEYFVLQNTRMSLVMDMADEIVNSIKAVFPLKTLAVQEVAATKIEEEQITMLKATGIVRKVDELGRVVIPMELRKTLEIGEREPLEIFVNGDSIVLKKYAPGCTFTDSLDDLVTYKGKLVSKKAIGEMAILVGL